VEEEVVNLNKEVLGRPYRRVVMSKQEKEERNDNLKQIRLKGEIKPPDLLDHIDKAGDEKLGYKNFLEEIRQRYLVPLEKKNLVKQAIL
jgi:hypothetical protein